MRREGLMEMLGVAEVLTQLAFLHINSQDKPKRLFCVE